VTGDGSPRGLASLGAIAQGAILPGVATRGEVPGPVEPPQPVVPDTPTVPADPTPDREAPAPDDPAPPQPDGPDVPHPDE